MKKMIFYGLGVVVLLAVIAILASYTNTPTGAAIKVESLDASDKIIKSQAGKMQSLVQLQKSALKK